MENFLIALEPLHDPLGSDTVCPRFLSSEGDTIVRRTSEPSQSFLCFGSFGSECC